MNDLTFSITLNNHTFNIQTNNRHTLCSYVIDDTYKTSLVFASNTYANVKYKNTKFSGTVTKQNNWYLSLDMHTILQKRYNILFFETTKQNAAIEISTANNPLDYSEKILCLYDLLIKYPHIKVVSSIEEAPYISGDLKSLRLEQAERLQEYLPDEQKEFGLRFCNILRAVKAVAVDIKVKDGDIFNWCGGCIILETPGHTNGHISLYLKEEKVLITGDAATIENGELVIANPQFTLDIDKAEESLRKIKAYGAEKIICYHGGLFRPKTSRL